MRIQIFTTVIKREHMEQIEKTNCKLGAQLIEDKYYLVNCSQCDYEFGKKIFDRSCIYLVFGKEKINYNDIVTLLKEDKW